MSRYRCGRCGRFRTHDNDHPCIRPTDVPQLDYAPLERRIRLDNNGHAPLSLIAATLGVTPRSVRRWRQSGSIILWRAERAADRLGLHPVDIWPDYYELVAA